MLNETRRRWCNGRKRARPLRGLLFYYRRERNKLRKYISFDVQNYFAVRYTRASLFQFSFIGLDRQLCNANAMFLAEINTASLRILACFLTWLVSIIINSLPRLCSLQAVIMCEWVRKFKKNVDIDVIESLFESVLVSLNFLNFPVFKN